MRAAVEIRAEILSIVHTRTLVFAGCSSSVTTLCQDTLSIRTDELWDVANFFVAFSDGRAGRCLRARDPVSVRDGVETQQRQSPLQSVQVISRRSNSRQGNNLERMGQELWALGSEHGALSIHNSDSNRLKEFD